jgi:hypothetical protein
MHHYLFSHEDNCIIMADPPRKKTLDSSSAEGEEAKKSGKRVARDIISESIASTDCIGTSGQTHQQQHLFQQQQQQRRRQQHRKRFNSVQARRRLETETLAQQQQQWQRQQQQPFRTTIPGAAASTPSASALQEQDLYQLLLMHQRQGEQPRLLYPMSAFQNLPPLLGSTYNMATTNPLLLIQQQHENEQNALLMNILGRPSIPVAVGSTAQHHQQQSNYVTDPTVTSSAGLTIASAAAASLLPPSVGLPVAARVTSSSYSDPLANQQTSSSKSLQPSSQHFSKEFLKELLDNSELVPIEDRGLVSDATLVIVGQVRRFQVQQDDRKQQQSKLGVGLCCKYCYDSQTRQGRKFMYGSSGTLSQSTRVIFRHLTEKCPDIPEHIKSVLIKLQKQEDSKIRNESAVGLSAAAAAAATTNPGRPVYGRRKAFFERVWARLHNQPTPDIDPDVGFQKKNPFKNEK